MKKCLKRNRILIETYGEMIKELKPGTIRNKMLKLIEALGKENNSDE